MRWECVFVRFSVYNFKCVNSFKLLLLLFVTLFFYIFCFYSQIEILGTPPPHNYKSRRRRRKKTEKRIKEKCPYW